MTRARKFGFRLLRVPQFGPLLRFQSPLVKPGKRISRTRLSPIPSSLRSWQVGAALGETKKPERSRVRFLGRHVEQAACQSFRDEPGLFRGAQFWGASRTPVPVACDDGRTCGAAG